MSAIIRLDDDSGQESKYYKAEGNETLQISKHKSNSLQNGMLHRSHNHSGRHRSNRDDLYQIDERVRLTKFEDWSEQISKAGKKYYYNCKTEVSQWEKPAEWAECERRQMVLLKQGGLSFTADDSRSNESSNHSFSYAVPSTSQEYQQRFHDSVPLQQSSHQHRSSNKTAYRGQNALNDYESPGRLSEKRPVHNVEADALIYTHSAKGDEWKRLKQGQQFKPDSASSSSSHAQRNDDRRRIACKPGPSTFSSDSINATLYTMKSDDELGKQCKAAEPVYTVNNALTNFATASRTGAGDNGGNNIYYDEKIIKMYDSSGRSADSKRYYNEQDDDRSNSKKRHCDDKDMQRIIDSGTVCQRVSSAIQTSKSYCTLGDLGSERLPHLLVEIAERNNIDLSDNDALDKIKRHLQSALEGTTGVDSRIEHFINGQADISCIKDAETLASDVQCDSQPSNQVGPSSLDFDVPPVPSLLDSHKLFYKDHLPVVIRDWAASHFENQAFSLASRSFQTSLEVAQISADLKCARSLVRTAEIRSTLLDQRVAYLRKKYYQLESLSKPVSSSSVFASLV